MQGFDILQVINFSKNSNTRHIKTNNKGNIIVNKIMRALKEYEISATKKINVNILAAFLKIINNTIIEEMIPQK